MYRDVYRRESQHCWVGAGIASVDLIAPSIEQVWFVEFIAKTTGDIGFQVAFSLAEYYMYRLDG